MKKNNGIIKTSRMTAMEKSPFFPIKIPPTFLHMLKEKQGGRRISKKLKIKGKHNEPERRADVETPPEPQSVLVSGCQPQHRKAQKTCPPIVRVNQSSHLTFLYKLHYWNLVSR